MSVFDTTPLPCPACAESCAVPLVHSLNIARAPAFREALLDDSFQSHTCEHCAARFRIDPRFTLLDVDRGVWIAALPAGQSQAWQHGEARAQDQFDRLFGTRASPVARSLGSGLKARVVFGWPALREKLVADDLGVDDVDLELAKLAVLKSGAVPMSGPDAALRLLGGDAESLDLAVEHGTSGALSGGIRVPRMLLHDTAAADWAPLRRRLTTGIYVDIARLWDPAVG